MKSQLTFTSRTITEWNYDFIRAISLQLDVATALTFGNALIPYALMDGKVSEIVLAEYLPSYRRRSLEEFKHYSQITVTRYFNRDPVSFKEPDILQDTYDLIVVASPIGGHLYYDHSRLNTTRWALEHSDLVILHDTQRRAERATLNIIHSEHPELNIQIFDQNNGHYKQLAVLQRFSS